MDPLNVQLYQLRDPVTLGIQLLDLSLESG